jgi:hypothetical protein
VPVNLAYHVGKGVIAMLNQESLPEGYIEVEPLEDMNNENIALKTYHSNNYSLGVQINFVVSM